VVRRVNKGRKLLINVDDYPQAVLEFTWLTDSSDTRLDNPRYIYFGRNESTRPGDGFKGCLFRAQFDNVYPLKRVFQDPRPDYIELEPADQIREDMCGFEEITHAPEEAEFRPTPSMSPNATASTDGDSPWGLSSTEVFITVGVVLGGLLLFLCVLVIIGRFMSRQKGEYKTHEAKDAQYYDNPDFAIASGTTGQPEVQKKKEWFI